MRYDTFIDAGFFRACAARHAAARTSGRVAAGDVQPHARRLARWVRQLAQAEDGPLAGGSLGTPAIYEGRFPRGHRGWGPQKGYVRVLREEGFEVRLSDMRWNDLELRGAFKTALLETVRAFELAEREFVDKLEKRLAAQDQPVVEKGVDTLLAIDCVEGALQDRYDVALLLSGDADFVPAVRAVHRAKKRVILAIPPGAANANVADLLLEAVDDRIDISSEDFERLYRRRDRRRGA